MSKINMNGLKSIIGNAIAFGKKNAPSIMTGGSILLGWAAAYVFWKQSKKAEQKIKNEEDKLSEEESLETKEKFVIYLQYCWMALVMGVGSSGLAIAAHKMDLSRLVEMYAMTQFLENKNGEQKTMIDKLKGEVDNKRIREIENEIIDEKYPKDEILKEVMSEPVGESNSTLFIDKVTHTKFRANIVDVTSGIYDFNRMLTERRNSMIKKRTKFSDPFVSQSDTPFGDLDNENGEYYSDVYSSLGLDIFLDCIGESSDEENDTRLGELLEFRYYGGGELLKPAQILFYKKYTDPKSGFPEVCFIDYTEYLSPTSELIERNPL